MKPSAWRAALRIARRDALRAKGRSALVVAMIALPVLGVTAADITARSGQPTPQERATRTMGAADAYVVAQRPGWRLQQAPDPAGGISIVSQQGAKPVPTEEEAARAAQPTELLLTQALPPGARVVPVQSPSEFVGTSTAHGQLPVQAYGVDLADPSAEGLVTLRRGSWPHAPYEVAATTAFLAEAGLEVGRTTTLAGTDRPLRITAAVEYPGELNAVRLVGRPGELAGLLAAAGRSPESGDPRGLGWLVSLPGGAAFGWEDVRRTNTYGFSVTSRAVLADPPPDGAVPLYRDDPDRLGATEEAGLNRSTVVATVAGMALLEIVLLAGPAFAVGARRSRRQLGLVAAQGGDRRHVRAVVLAGGVVLGGAGALAGTALGAVAVALGRSWLETRAGARFGHFALEPADLLGILAVGMLTGVLAAVVPAVQASRQHVVDALTGRGTTRPPARWLTLLGAAGVLGGTALALLGATSGARTRVVTAGSMLAELGLVACTPFLVGQAGRLGRFLPLSPRLALRDATRQRGRTAPAVAAVMAAVAGAVAVLTFQTTGDAAARSDYLAAAPVGAVTLPFGPDRNAERLRAAVEHTVPDLGPRADLRRVGYGACDGTGGSFCGRIALRVVPELSCPPVAGPPGSAYGTRIAPGEAERLLATDPRCHPGKERPYQYGELVSGDATLLHNLLAADQPEAARALADGKAAVFDPSLVKDGTLTLELTRFGATGPEGNTASTLALPAVVVTAELPAVRAVLPAATAERAGLVLAESGSVWRPARAPSTVSEQRAAAAITAAGGHGGIGVERGYRGGDDGVVGIGLAVAAVAVAVAAAGIATGLAAADSQRDLSTLAAVGAAPGIRRRLSGFQCAVIALLGAALGSAAGLVPAAAIQRVQNLGRTPEVDPTGAIFTGTHALVVPWTYLAVVLLALPVLSWALAAGFTRSRVAATRRTD
ncbi:FtsX-like permease family protein [Kitasatospora sp. NPDC088346]|uniref:FtsX-like permease family protein n=1 Tax=Kitasatospora sp. NPDC088346 TaxID=3364073 RepID=UPI00381C1AD1